MHLSSTLRARPSPRPLYSARRCLNLRSVSELDRFNRIVVLTGAGVSAESGISTFRDQGGLWEKHRLEDVATPEAFARDPRLVWKFYSARRRRAAAAEANAAHLALARFARARSPEPGSFLLVTQNVDGLHERAERQVGSESSSILAMHGSLTRSRCSVCQKVIEDSHPHLEEDGTGELPLSACCGALLRPDIVWFGEMPMHLEEISAAVNSCDCFVSIGTSGNVYPAAAFIAWAAQAGACTISLNQEPIPQQSAVQVYLEGPATETVPSLFGRA